MRFIIRNCYPAIQGLNIGRVAGIFSGKKLRNSRPLIGDARRRTEVSAPHEFFSPQIRVFLAPFFALGEKRMLAGVLEEFASIAKGIRA